MRWAGHGRLAADLLRLSEDGASEPADCRVLAGAETAAVAPLLPAPGLVEEAGLRTSRLPL